MRVPPSPDRRADGDSDSDSDDGRIRVYLRLRPMNNLERSRRSKDCVELHDDPKILTVDAPLQGEYDFSCDMVFDEGASQDEVYHEAVASVPRRLLDGVDCTVLAYGQTGTGKTHTMIGEGLGTEINVRTKERRLQRDVHGLVQEPPAAHGNATEDVGSPVEHSRQQDDVDGDNDDMDPALTEGMIPRTLSHIFEVIKDEPNNVEFIVRCSFVEIYLEKIVDLLCPDNENILLRNDAEGHVSIHGASEICCVEPLDVLCLLARGTANRTQSSTGQNVDSSRSHALVTIRVDRIDRSTGMQRTSRLQMLDLAGSELARTKSSRQAESAVIAEGKMINQSLACLSNMIRATLAQQGDADRAAVHPDKYANASKLARLLQPSFGGKVFTTVICTASPSSYNIGETINTVRFAQRVQKIRNAPKPREDMTVEACRQKLADAEQDVNGLNGLVKALAAECRRLKNDGSDSGDARLWKAINEIAEISRDDENDVGQTSDGTTNSNDGSSEVEIVVRRRRVRQSRDQHASYTGDHNNDNDTGLSEHAKAEIEQANQLRDRAENATRDLMSEVTSLRSQNELLLREKHKLETDLRDAKTEIRGLLTHLDEVEHDLRTSQFRENEATTFLRQFRSFYLRLLKHKASKGNNDTNAIYAEEVSRKIPGVPELEDLIDIDTLMMASGLIEENEVGEDTNAPNYVPSQNALTRSRTEAEQASKREMELIGAMGPTGKSSTANGESSAPRTTLSVVKRTEAAQLTSYRQKLVQSPAGLLAMKKEKELERELVDLSSKCINLQNAVNAEKAMVEAMSSRQGALGKIKSAQEMNMLRQELERKTNDLQAIVLKMNELHLVNKTFDEKVDSRERHVSYLEEHLSDLQSRNRRLVIERQEAEKRMKEETVQLKKLLDAYSVHVWQLDESDQTNRARHRKLRLLVPFNEQTPVEDTAKRRHSIKQAIEDIAVPDYPEFTTISTQTDESNMSASEIVTADTSIQTDPSPASVDNEAQTEGVDQADSVAQTEPVASADSATQTVQTESADIEIQTDVLPSQEMSCQTDAIETAETSEVDVQTDEVQSKETKDSIAQTNAPPTSNEISIQTDSEEKEEDEPKAPKKEAADISVQTETEMTTEQGMQTEQDVEVRPVTVDHSTQTDEMTVEVPRPPEAELATIATQTDFAADEIETKKPCAEIAIQTDDLPDVIDVAGSRSVDTGSLADSEQLLQVNTSNKGLSVNSSNHNHNSGTKLTISNDTNFEGSMSSLGDRWRGQNRPSNTSQTTRSEDGSEDSLTTSNIKQLKTKFAKGTSNVAPADNYAKFNSSASSLFKSTPVSSKYSDGTSHKETVSLPRSAVARPPLVQQPQQSHVGTGLKKRSGKDTAVDAPLNVPEWMSKRKELAMKAGDQSKALGREGSLGSAGTVGKVQGKRRVHSMEFMNTSAGRLSVPLSPKRTPKTVGKPSVVSTTSSVGSGNQAEWLQRVRLMNKQIDLDDDSSSTDSSVHDTKSPVSAVPKSPVPKSEKQLEWMERFKQIGMKGEETVVEASGMLAAAAALKAQEAEEEDDGRPEWMKRYQQIGQKGVEEVVIVNPMHGDGMYDEEELERIRKEEKRARKRERKAAKKAKKEKERQNSGR